MSPPTGSERGEPQGDFDARLLSGSERHPSAKNDRPQSMNAYIITTRQNDQIDTQRRRLEAHGFHVTVVDGIKGAELKASEYFQRIQFWRSRSGRMMTPGELGCALSHQEALRLASESGHGMHLILEDDFIASDEALRWIFQVCKNLRTGTLLHLGGLEGTPERIYRYVRGDAVTGHPGVFEVDPRDLVFLKRSVAYVVDAATAKQLADLVEQTPYVIDDHSYAITAGVVERVWFSWVVSHPLDLRHSSIDPERQHIHQIQRTASWRVKSLSEVFRKRSLQWKLAWRQLTTARSRFLRHQQTRNQLPPEKTVM